MSDYRDRKLPDDWKWQPLKDDFRSSVFNFERIIGAASRMDHTRPFDSGNCGIIITKEIQRASRMILGRMLDHVLQIPENADIVREAIKTIRLVRTMNL